MTSHGRGSKSAKRAPGIFTPLDLDYTTAKLTFSLDSDSLVRYCKTTKDHLVRFRYGLRFRLAYQFWLTPAFLDLRFAYIGTFSMGTSREGRGSVRAAGAGVQLRYHVKESLTGHHAAHAFEQPQSSVVQFLCSFDTSPLPTSVSYLRQIACMMSCWPLIFYTCMYGLSFFFYLSLLGRSHWSTPSFRGLFPLLVHVLDRFPPSLQNLYMCGMAIPLSLAAEKGQRQLPYGNVF